MADQEEEFGDPQTARGVSQGFADGSKDLQTLMEQVDRDVRETVPDRWGGAGADSYQRFWFRFMRSGAGLGSPMDFYSQILADAATIMATAKEQLREAREFAARNRLTINQDFSVRADEPDRPGAREALQLLRQLVDRARTTEALAQHEIRRANRMLNAAAEPATRQFLEIAAAVAGGAAGGGGRRGRSRSRFGGPRIGRGSGRRRKGTPEEEEQMLYGPEGKVRLPAEGSGRWVNPDGTPGIPGDSIFVPKNPREFGIHPNSPSQEIRWREGVPDLRPHAVRPEFMPKGWGDEVPHVENLPLRGTSGDAVLADEVAGQRVGMSAEEFRVWRRQFGYEWHHYSYHEMTLVPHVVHGSVSHQGPFR